MRAASLFLQGKNESQVRRSLQGLGIVAIGFAMPIRDD